MKQPVDKLFIYFNETQNNYGGRPEEFIAALQRPDKKEKGSYLLSQLLISVVVQQTW